MKSEWDDDCPGDAIHEAAHAVVSAALGLRVDSIELRPHPRVAVHGDVRLIGLATMAGPIADVMCRTDNEYSGREFREGETASKDPAGGDRVYRLLLEHWHEIEFLADRLCERMRLYRHDATSRWWWRDQQQPAVAGDTRK